MAQSKNTRADLTAKGVSYLGFPNYGDIMMGDVAFEFFDGKNVDKNIQLPYTSIQFVEGDVTLRGKIGRQFRITLTTGQKVRFASKDAGKILKLFRDHLGNSRVLRAPSFFSVVKTAFQRKQK